jgi:hypothetical protein
VAGRLIFYKDQEVSPGLSDEGVDRIDMEKSPAGSTSRSMHWLEKSISAFLIEVKQGFEGM